jgi:DNA-3-methyladenine glycosylase II
MRKAILHLKRSDPVLAGLIGRIGSYRIEFAEADFATLVRCIIYQQLSGKVALTIFNRLAAAASDGKPMTPESVLRLHPAKMRAIGLSQQKIAYIRDLASRCRAGEIDLNALQCLSDHDVMTRLTQFKGIGVWTVHMFLIFALRRLDVLPAADLGIRAAVRKEYGLAHLPTPAEVERMAQPWRPYASVASWYLWRSLEDKAGL